MNNEVLPGNTLQSFELAAYPPPGPERIGILAGRTSAFTSRFGVMAADVRSLPEGGPGLCGEESGKWSDHCGMYARLVPAPR